MKNKPSRRARANVDIHHTATPRANAYQSREGEEPGAKPTAYPTPAWKSGVGRQSRGVAARPHKVTLRLS